MLQHKKEYRKSPSRATLRRAVHLSLTKPFTTRYKWQIPSFLFRFVFFLLFFFFVFLKLYWFEKSINKLIIVLTIISVTSNVFQVYCETCRNSTVAPTKKIKGGEKNEGLNNNCLLHNITLDSFCTSDTHTHTKLFDTAVTNRIVFLFFFN